MQIQEFYFTKKGQMPNPFPLLHSSQPYFTYIRMSVALCTYYILYCNPESFTARGRLYYIHSAGTSPSQISPISRIYSQMPCQIAWVERADTEPRKLATVQHMQEHCCTRDDMYSICNNGRRCCASVMSIMFDRTINLITAPDLVIFSVPILASYVRMPTQM